MSARRQPILVGLFLAFLMTIPSVTDDVRAQTAPPPATWAELDEALTELATRASFLAAELVEGECRAVHALNAEAVMPIGSSFKLYLLAELGAQIEAGELRWEEVTELRDADRSVPHGPLLFAPEGARFTLRYLAERMIQVSDNTATDALLHRLGREAVEDRLAETGHHDPALNTPFLSTHEWAVLKFLWSEDELRAYLASSLAEKRRRLEAETRGLVELDALFSSDEAPSEPLRIDTIEWFADRHDLCRLLAALQGMSEREGLLAVREVIALNDGIGLDPERWPYAGFKGGSEPGVLAMNWLVERNDGRRFVLSAAFADSGRNPDLMGTISAMQAAFALLYETP